MVPEGTGAAGPPIGPCYTRRRMETPIAFLFATLMASAIVLIVLRSALVPESRYTRWSRSVTGPNGKWAFALLLVLWVIAMSVLASLGLPGNVVGGFALLGLLGGFFIFMGFIWAVIGE
jgi:hypothetical protein